MSNTNESASSTKKRKRRKNNDDDYVNALKDMASSLESDLLKATNKLGHYVGSLAIKATLNVKRGELYVQLMNVEGLNMDEKYITSIMIGQDSALLLVFPTIPNEYKANWIRHVIGQT